MTETLIKPIDFCEIARSVINTEATAVAALFNKIDLHFVKACEFILECRGRVIVSGMGKSGHIAAKIAATLSSTGTPAFFMNLGEAAHGDFGMLTMQDVLIIISNSGNIAELVTLIPFIKKLEIPLIAMTGNKASILAQHAHALLDVAITEEACALGLAPTTSSTVALVMGDALSVAIQKAKGFTVDDYARSHPGGSLGRRLLLTVTDVWHTQEHLPVVLTKTTIADALLEMTSKKLGMVCVVDSTNKLLGIYTDGDLRRTLNKNLDIKTTYIETVMSVDVKTIATQALVTDALAQMQKASISVLVVVDTNNKLLGIVHLHDILRLGIY
jgi:arabinose-5-phosphate isomerase